MNETENEVIPPGLASRVVVSILVLFGVLIFAIIYVAFFAISFNLFQKIAVIVVALLAVTAILGAMWASWGIKYGKALREISAGKHRNCSRSLSVRKETGMILFLIDSDTHISEICLALFFSPLLPEGQC